VSKRGRVAVVLGVFAVVAAGLVGAIQGKPAWERSRVISALEGIPGVQRAELEGLDDAPELTLDAALRPEQVEAALVEAYEVTEDRLGDEPRVRATYRGVEFSVHDVYATEWIVGGATMARQAGVTGGRSASYEFNAHIDGSVVPTVQGVFDWAKSARVDPDLTFYLYSESSFDLETSLGAADADLTPLTTLEEVDTPYRPNIVRMWGGDDAKPSAHISVDERSEAYEAMDTYADLTPAITSTIEVADKFSVHVTSKDTAQVRRLIDDLSRNGGATVTSITTQLDSVTIDINAPELTTVSERIRWTWPRVRAVTIKIDGHVVVNRLPATALTEFAPVLSSLSNAAGLRPSLDGEQRQKSPIELAISIDDSGSLTEAAKIVRKAGFPGRITISMWDRRDGAGGVFFGSLETTATSKGSEFRAGISEYAHDWLDTWNATVPKT
jgi:hypothetical protein